MRWKPEVTLTENNGWQLHLADKVTQIDERDTYLVKAVQKGINDDEELVKLIAKKEGIDETAAAFGLAQFVLDYNYFIAPDNSHYIISN